MNIIKLIINIRLYKFHNFQDNLKEKEFAEFLLKIKVILLGFKENFQLMKVKLISENLITLLSNMIIISKDKLTDLIDFVCSNLVKNYDNINYLVSRAILKPKNI